MRARVSLEIRGVTELDVVADRLLY